MFPKTRKQQIEAEMAAAEKREKEKQEWYNAQHTEVQMLIDCGLYKPVWKD